MQPGSQIARGASRLQVERQDEARDVLGQQPAAMPGRVGPERRRQLRQQRGQRRQGQLREAHWVEGRPDLDKLLGVRGAHVVRVVADRRLEVLDHDGDHHLRAAGRARRRRLRGGRRDSDGGRTATRRERPHDHETREGLLRGGP
eukprot:3154426-Prymnesium_polylepis.1